MWQLFEGGVYSWAAFIKITAVMGRNRAEMWQLFEGGVYSWAAFIKITAVMGRHSLA